MKATEFLTTRDIAALFGVRIETAARWLATSQFSGAICTPGGRWRIDRAAVDDYFAASRREPVADGA